LLHSTLKLSDLTSQFHTVINSICLICTTFEWKVLCVYPYDRIKFHVTVCNNESEDALICTENIFLVAAIFVCVMKEITFENCYTFFKGILLQVNLSGSAIAPI